MLHREMITEHGKKAILRVIIGQLLLLSKHEQNHYNMSPMFPS